MSERAKLILISLWLLLSIPFNVASLKQVVRGAFWLGAHLTAGLDRLNWLQYLFAAIFVLTVVVLFLCRIKIGRTLIVVLLLGSCCIMGMHVLVDLAIRASLPAHWIMMGIIVLIDVGCLRALRDV
jgi:hypothetical protein